MPEKPSQSQQGRRAAAIFLDRDGTLIEDRGHLASPADVVLFKETLPALRRLQPHFQLFIVTNQSGVAKGELTLAEVDQVNTYLVKTLEEAGVAITAVYVCPHQRTDDCACIKPKSFFLERAVMEHGVDLRRSYSIGDHLHDVELANYTGGIGIYVLSGHGLKHWAEAFGKAIVTAHIGEAAEWILAHKLDSNPPAGEMD